MSFQMTKTQSLTWKAPITQISFTLIPDYRLRIAVGFNRSLLKVAMQHIRPFVLPSEHEEYRRYLSQFTADVTSKITADNGYDYGEQFYSQYLDIFQNTNISQVTPLQVNPKDLRLYEQSCDVVAITSRPINSAAYEGYRRWVGTVAL
jgi:hypothetical protein